MGTDVGAAAPIRKVETEQKFLVDLREFEAVRGKLRRRRVRQCYVAVQGDGDGWEVRYREVRCDAVDLGSCDVCRRKPGRCWNCGLAREEHPCHHCTAGRRIKAATTEHICTLKRRHDDTAVARDEIEFTINAAVFCAVWAAASWRVEKDRYDGAAIGDWTVDIFTSGPLRGVAVAELEMPAEYVAARFYLAAQQSVEDAAVVWPNWIIQESAGWPTADTREPTDLTAERINLVAAGVVEKSERLRRILGNAAAAEMTALAQATGQYDDPGSMSLPPGKWLINAPSGVIIQSPQVRKSAQRLTRQGVRDLGYSKRGGVL